MSREFLTPSKNKNQAAAESNKPDLRVVSENPQTKTLDELQVAKTGPKKEKAVGDVIPGLDLTKEEKRITKRNRSNMKAILKDTKAIRRGTMTASNTETGVHYDENTYYKRELGYWEKRLKENLKEARSICSSFINIRANLEKNIPGMEEELRRFNILSTTAWGQVMYYLNKDFDLTQMKPKDIAKLFAKMELIPEGVYKLRNEFKETINEKAGEYFEPLLRRAKADVRSYLIKHCNQITENPKEVSDFLEEALKVEYEVEYIFDKNKDYSGLADYEWRTVYINLAYINRLENGEIDQGDLHDTMVHEIIHMIAGIVKPDQNWEINYKEILGESEDPKNMFDFNLNELMTALVTGEILERYYQQELGTLQLKKGEEYLYSYDNFIAPYFALIEKYGPEKIERLKVLTVDLMFRADRKDDLIEFFQENQDLYQDLGNILNQKTYLAA